MPIAAVLYLGRVPSLVFWSRDPDGTQHNTGDSPNTVTPGINGPTSLAGIKNADNNLAQLRKALDEFGLAANTNIIISSDPCEPC